MVEIRETVVQDLDAYADVEIAFVVTARLDVRAKAGGGWRLREVPVATPWRKDYDALDGGPPAWSTRFDVRHWRLLAAFDGDRRIGGACLAWKTPGLEMLGGREEDVVLWDLRVRPNVRRRGVGRALFDAAVAWARARSAAELVVETQDVNVPACRFYRAMRCTLASVEPGAYAALPDETKLVWRRWLRPELPRGRTPTGPTR